MKSFISTSRLAPPRPALPRPLPSSHRKHSFTGRNDCRGRGQPIRGRGFVGWLILPSSAREPCNFPGKRQGRDHAHPPLSCGSATQPS
ncbi:hypothetical protein ElyMa_000014100 [Elysia marginata]|uniref:Uncharacterized protein n=1 Tax=Elysia marginata TaxID=1093978 RepID=A0AAV4EAB8_9GAST|nr:hypothetical protein ElyMa_000014100 [Elysia marginata]